MVGIPQTPLGESHVPGFSEEYYCQSLAYVLTWKLFNQNELVS